MTKDFSHWHDYEGEPDFEGGAIDCHWEKRYITCPDDIERLIEPIFEVREAYLLAGLKYGAYPI
jgi:hypothetical protein